MKCTVTAQYYQVAALPGNAGRPLSEPTSMPYTWRDQRDVRPCRLPRRALPAAVLTVVTCGGGCVLILLDACLRL